MAAHDTMATRPSLLMKVRDPQDRAAWARFVEAYTPLVFGFCRRRGLQAADAADVAQEVMRAVAAALPGFEYEPQRGRFRDWLFRVTRSKLCDFHRDRQRQPAGSGQTTVHDILREQPDPAGAADPAEAATWQESWRRQAFEWAVNRVRDEFQPATWKAFWGTAVEGRAARDVADELGMSTGAVYIARSRVLSRLREAVGQIDDQD
jgi:RNA polymerase sigma-70 factor (ECF subfamily)